MRFKLKEVAIYRKEVIAIESVNPSNYLSTENMLQNKGGKKDASSIPDVKVVSAYKKGDILISNIRPYFKKIWLADTDGGASNDVLIIQPCKISSFELYYILSSDHFFNYMTATSKGTKMPRGDKSSVMEYEFSIYNRAIFQKISKTLQSIDLNIETNKRIVNRLEMVGSELFKNWFIDFEFPNEQGQPYKSSGGKMAASELGLIPSNWEVCSLNDLISKLSKGTTPRKVDYLKSESEEEVYFIKVKDLKSESIDVGNLEKIPVDIHENQLKRSIIKERDILFSIAGTIGKVAVVNKELNNSNINQALAFIRLTDPDRHFHYIYQVLKSERINKDVASRIVQAVQANVSLSTLKNLKIVNPSNDTLDLYNALSRDIYKKIQNSHQENVVLKSLRDLLILKLLSGEIELPIKETVQN